MSEKESGVWHGVGIHTPKEAQVHSFIVPKDEQVLTLTIQSREEFERLYLGRWESSKNRREG
ncbi:hypothetical protein [Acinetobacter baumannii]|uniref:hypothetical protein n=1 Tax=Acinetobacter baumannii TaxID=470 RepID=UPI00112C4EDE|nr:hypothetical protein [Acinetobacter baumannii]TPT55486.1 hypothetical protein FJU64_08120 [Acinetobacter baumannii]